MTRRVVAPAIVLSIAIVGLGAGVIAAGALGTQPDSEWHAFEGTWSVTGTRSTLPTGQGRDAAVVRLSGAVALIGEGGLGRGFQGVAIGYDDGDAERVGRWMWTDERGDRIFGELSGEPMATGRQFTGTITGGTGRHAGIAGDFGFTWQYVVSPESGVVAGRATGLRGRYRRDRDTQ